MYFLYLLQCRDKSIYTGIATDVRRRFVEHRAGKGGHYTRAHGARKILYIERCGNRSDALKREAQVKRMKRIDKLKLIS